MSMQGKTSEDTAAILKSVGICKLTRARSLPVEKWIKLHETGIAKYTGKEKGTDNFISGSNEPSNQ